MLQRKTAYKVQAGELLTGNPVFDGDRLNEIDCSGKKVSRVNILGNIVDKYVNDEKKFCALTLDDGSGQIRIKGFSDQFDLLNSPEIGDTICVIGMARHFNDELYVLPEIIKIVDPRWLNVRRLELGANPSQLSMKENSSSIPLQSQAEVNLLSRDSGGNIMEAEKNYSQNNPYQINTVTEKVSDSPKEKDTEIKIESPKLHALEIIRKRKEIELKELASEMKKSENDLNSLINELITEGEIFELKPGHLCSVN